MSLALYHIVLLKEDCLKKLDQRLSTTKLDEGTLELVNKQKKEFVEQYSEILRVVKEKEYLTIYLLSLYEEFLSIVQLLDSNYDMLDLLYS